MPQDSKARLRDLVIELRKTYTQKRLEKLMNVDQSTISKVALGTRGAGNEVLDGLRAFGLDGGFVLSDTDPGAWREHMTKAIPDPIGPVRIERDDANITVEEFIADARNRVTAAEAAILRTTFNRAAAANLPRLIEDALRYAREPQSKAPDRSQAANTAMPPNTSKARPRPRPKDGSTT